MRQRDETRIIKKYPNRRLYDTHTSTYITLSEIKQMVLDKEIFEVIDVKSSENLTKNILLQILLEEESCGVPLFSSSVLLQIIRSYSHETHGLLCSFFEENMHAFAEIQDSIIHQSQTTHVASISEAFIDARGCESTTPLQI